VRYHVINHRLNAGFSPGLIATSQSYGCGQNSTLTKSEPINQLWTYDKTLHNWLCPRDGTRNPKFVQIVHKGAPGQIHVFLKFILSLGSPTEVTCWRILTHDISLT